MYKFEWAKSGDHKNLNLRDSRTTDNLEEGRYMASSSSSGDDDGGTAAAREAPFNPAFSASSNSSSAGSPASSAGLKIRSKGGNNRKKKLAEPTARRELKRAIEKKFRLRYASLQQAYERRLEALAARVQDAVTQAQQDATIHCLQENALTSEYASARLGEIVHECFYGERERYIKAMSDQIAWQASDLRESQQKLRVVQRREADAQRQWELAQRDIQALHHQLDVRVQELQEQKKREAERDARYRSVRGEKEAARQEVDTLKQSVQSFEVLQHEHEELKSQMQREREQQQVAHNEVTRRVKELQETKNKQASEQEATHLKHLLSISENKSREVAQTLQQLQSEDYPNKLARVEMELAHQRQFAALTGKDHEDLKKRYEEFGEQVEQYMSEQTQEKAAVLAKGEEQVKQLQTQLESVGRQAQDALKAKQGEVVRAMDQLKFRQEALVKAEKKIAALEERGAALEAQQMDAKIRHEKQVSSLEKEVVRWRHELEKEQDKVASLQKVLVDVKEKHEGKVASLQDALTRQSRQGAQEKELEARTRWQNELVAKQDTRIEELKAKYDAALENQQTELLRARQLAIDSASATAAKWEKAKTTQKEEELEKRRHLEMAAREKERKEEQRAQKLMQQEFDEREKRLLERERTLAEKEKRDERRRSEEAKKSAAEAAAAAATPRVVVVNVNAADEEEDSNQRGKGGAMARVTTGNRRRSGRLEESNEEKIPMAQHVAELQAKEAQVALRAEERVQKLMQEFQERKETEFRAAMVNVRKGIQKLELSLEETKAEKKRAEEQLLSERQAFVKLKHECEEAKDSKRTMLQRLEEANENLGKLRGVVGDSHSRCQALEEQYKSAVREKEASELATTEAHRTSEGLREQLARLTEAAARLESSLDTSVETSEQSKKELLDRIAVLEHQMQAREERFVAEMSAVEEQNTRELRNATSQYDSHLRKLQETIEEGQLRHQEAETKANQLELSVRELTAGKEALQAMTDQLKMDSSRQRKEFADLSRMHKNLTDSVSGRLGSANEAQEEERSKRVMAEMRALKAEKMAERAKNDKQKELQTCRLRLQQLAREWAEARKGMASEMNVGWVHLQKEVSLAGMEWRKRTEKLLQEVDAMWRRKAKEDKQEWKQRIAQKDKEMDALLSSQRVNDQSKYDQVVARLEAKARELEDLEARLSTQVDASARLQQTIQRLEEEQKLHLMEHSQLHDRLSGTQAASQRDVEEKEKERVRTLLEKRKSMCRELHGFVASIAGESGVDFPVSLLEEDDGKEQKTGDRRQLTAELSKLATRLREQQAQAVAEATVNAKEGASTPLVFELDAAKKALSSFWSDPARDDEYDGHMPWYLRAARAIKQQREASEQRVAGLRVELAAKEAEVQSVRDGQVQWQEANNLLRFEKDTLLREMELLRQTLQKRKEQELQELRAEYDVRIEQLKQRQDRAIMKTDQDYETAMAQLRDLLEAERRSTSHAKNEDIELVRRPSSAKMALERTEEELKDAQLKLDKETDELREA
ncbi:hypothetical protein BBJ28_00019728, partial [Nothophytophthora sp. Chile5]